MSVFLPEISRQLNSLPKSVWRAPSPPLIQAMMSAIAMAEDLGSEEAADLRLAVDEARTAFIVLGEDTSTPLVLTINADHAALCVKVSPTGANLGDAIRTASFAWQVLTSVTDDVSTFTRSSVDGLRATAGIRLVIAKSSMPQ